MSPQTVTGASMSSIVFSCLKRAVHSWIILMATSSSILPSWKTGRYSFQDPVITEISFSRKREKTNLDKMLPEDFVPWFGCPSVVDLVYREPFRHREVNTWNRLFSSVSGILYLYFYSPGNCSHLFPVHCCTQIMRRALLNGPFICLCPKVKSKKRACV